MLTDKKLAQIAIACIHDIFDVEYLAQNRIGSCMAHGMIDDDTYVLFLGIKDSKALPNHKASSKGWTVYADVRLNANTGAIKSIDYQLE